jgi:hypothetical protein
MIASVVITVDKANHQNLSNWLKLAASSAGVVGALAAEQRFRRAAYQGHWWKSAGWGFASRRRSSLAASQNSVGPDAFGDAGPCFAHRETSGMLQMISQRWIRLAFALAAAGV